MKVILFTDKSQFILLPTFGVIREPDGVYITVAIATVGVSVRLWKNVTPSAGV